MNSQSMHTLIDPLFQSKMPSFNGTMAATVLSKPQNMPGFLEKRTPPINGAYFTYDPRRKEEEGFPPQWSRSKISLLEGRSPVSHHSGMEGRNHIIYSQDSTSSEEEHSHSITRCHTPVKQGFTLYTQSPGISSPKAATSLPLRKQNGGGENSPPPPGSPVYFAVPKPVYRHSPCCGELGCVLGHRFSVEHGSPRLPHAVYKHDWVRSDARYAERPPVHRKAEEALLRQRGLQFEPVAEPLRRITVEAYGPGTARMLPAMMDPNYISYPGTPTRPLFASVSEQAQRLQTSPRGYPSLPPSHPTYEHMTSEVYQERSPMSKYGQLTQYPVFYYPQASEVVQSGCKNAHSKHREDVPVVVRHTVLTPREHYIVPQSLHGEIPLPSNETLPNHPFMQSFEYPCYAVPRFHLNASQPLAPSPHPHPHKPKTNTSPPVDQSKPSSPFLRVDPPRCTGQPGVSPPSTKTSRFFPSISSLLMDQHLLPPGAANVNRLMDYASCESRVTWPNQSKGPPASLASWPPPSPSRSPDCTHAAGTNGVNVRKIIYSPAVSPENKYRGPTSRSGDTVIKGCLKRSSSPPIKIKEEGRDLCEVEIMRKRQRVEIERDQVGNEIVCPPMPIIDNVFSLAPYQAYLQVSGLLFPERVPQTTSSEHCEVDTKLDIKEKMSHPDEQRPVASPAPQNICPNRSPGKPVVENYERKQIKREKVDPSYADNSVESPVCQQDCSKVTIKQEPEESGSCDVWPMLVIKKCEDDESESKASLTDGIETSHEPKTGELSAQVNPSPTQGDECGRHPQVANPVVPHPPAESKLKFKNIPPQCLKRYAYKIILPNMKHCNPIPQAEQPPAQPVANCIKPIAQKQELPIPVRQHFFELHQSLCKLVSKSVSTSSEQELRTWLSQLQPTEPASPSTKVQKVACLLGLKAREMWLDEEMKAALHKVTERLREYTAQERCPFPHVMRTGAVFLPMLVMKELLFPSVQGSFVDQVLHRHKVELRPTTLSEEKILIQLHKRACSSRLRRLMSLKHLPVVYADVVNLLYYACVCEHLGLNKDHLANGEKDDGIEEPPVFSDFSASPVSPRELQPQKYPTDQEAKSHLNRNRTKSRVKSSSRRMFLDNSLSDEEADDTEKTINGGELQFCKKNFTNPSEEGENSRSDGAVAEQDYSLVPPSPTSENSWTRPLTFDELSLSATDTETQESSTVQPGTRSSGEATPPVRSKSCSGVILKLRRMFSKGLKRKRARYQAVSDSGTSADPTLSKAEGSEGEVGDLCKRRPKATQRWQRTGSYSHALRPLSGSSKRKHRSLVKIKCCPYLSACHSAEHRRRWEGLRSAVQRARGAARFDYPDLVGKQICHLYEEDDKSEVWYRGEVLRVHEANANPLKTIFEVRYDSEPEWKYYLELLIDYKKGWLKIED